MMSRRLVQRFPSLRLFTPHPLVALGILESVLVLSLGDLVEIIPLFAPLVASPFFLFFHEIHDLLAVGLVIYATYKYHARLGIAATLVFIAVHIPYFVVQFPENAPELLRVLFNALGAILGIWLISQLRKTKKQVSLATVEWDTTFANISDWVSIQDNDFRIIKANKAFANALGMKPEEFIGRHCYEVIHGKNEASQDCSHKVAVETKKSVYKEFTNPHLGIHMEVVCSPIFNKQGAVTSTLHIGRDITERKKLQEQLMAQDRLVSIGQLVAGVAHEINNPLTSVVGFSELLLQRDLPDDVKSDLKIVNDEAQRATNIVKGLLTFARKPSEGKEPIDINTPVQIVMNLNAHRFAVNNIQVNTHLAEGLPRIIGNGSQLQQVFFNIVMNAEQIMLEAHDKGIITITTEQVGNIVRVFVADDGPGISPENMKKLFTPFFTTKAVGKGTGLGLSICHGIVIDHGGRIYAESEPGKGATFIVELPVTQAKTNQGE